jgi:hypothetical protein
MPEFLARTKIKKRIKFKTNYGEVVSFNATVPSKRRKRVRF